MIKTLNELLKETKYEGGEYMHWDFDRENSMTQHVTKFGNYNHAGCCLLVDAARNAALASLLPAAVKALRDCVSMLAEQGIELGSTHPVKATLASISEATKAVEGK